MEWFDREGGGGEDEDQPIDSPGSSNASSGAKNIAQQLQNLLQIPAIGKNDASVLSTPTTTDSKQLSVPEIEMMVPRYCSDLEADISQQEEGKENAFIRRETRVVPPRGSAQIYSTAQPKLPLLGRRSMNNNENSKVVVKREVTDGRLVAYLKDIGYQTFAPPAPPKPLGMNSNPLDVKFEFPSFLETMIRNDKFQNMPSQIHRQQDLIARNCIKLDGITNLTHLNATIEPAMKVLMRSQFVEPLPRKTMKYPHAKFVCTMCPYHMNSLLDAIEHIGSSRHGDLIKNQSLIYNLESVPMATDAHCEVVGELISRICSEHGLTEDNVQKRQQIIQFLFEVFHRNGLDCEVNMFGSSAGGYGFKYSDLNINVNLGGHEEVKNATNNKTAPLATSTSSDHLINISRIVDILGHVPQIKNLTPKYLMNKSHIHFKMTGFGPDVDCLIQFNNKPALLFSNLMQEYIKINSLVRPIMMAFRYWAFTCGIDDQDSGFLPPQAYPIMALQYLQDVRIIPVLHAIPKIDTTRPFATANDAFKAGFPNNSERKYTNIELGKGWLSLLYYYAVKFDYVERVVAISRPDILTTRDSTWNRKLSIEDPIIPSSNISRSATNNKILDYILACIKKSFLYFAIPRAEQGALYASVYDDRLIEDMTRMSYRYVFPTQSSLAGTTIGLRIIDSTSSVPPNEDELLKQPTATLKMIFGDDFTGRPGFLILFSSLASAHTCLKKEEYFYNFDLAQLCASGQPNLTCKACGSELHVRRDCPEESLPPLMKVYKPSDNCMLMLQKVIVSSYEKLALNDTAYRTRLGIKNEISKLLLEEFQDVQLTMFGSSENGFGLKTSDLDLCMTLKRHCFPTREDILIHIDANDTLTKVVNCLKRSQDLVDVFQITTAKVPIVKYHHEPTGIDGDISFYNLLALRNTLLLKTYNQLDPRVKILGCLIKKLGKLCEISDASKGSLSSYAYMLMLIHYLQQTDIPVLPVLQEIPPIGHPQNDSLPTFIVENCDSYFFEDVEKIKYIWIDYGRNTDTVDELWLGFLRYYTEVFSFENHVVSIARRALLLRRDKAWFTECIAIEDPFDKSHNMGSGLTRRMSVHIIKTLRKFRQVFHSEVDAADVAHARVHYFSRKTLKEGKLPIDRQCRRCHRIGHIARNCTEFVRDHASDTESLEGDDDDDDVELPTSITQQPLVEAEVRSKVEELNKVQHPNEVMNRHIQSLIASSASKQLKQTQNIPKENNKYKGGRVLKDFGYFWNMETARDSIDQQLLKMIAKETSPGVRFTPFVTNKAEKIQSFPVKNQNNVAPNIQHQQNSNPFNGKQTPNCATGFSLQDLNRRYGISQANVMMAAGGCYPSSVQPPPGFAPKFTVIPVSGIYNGNFQHQPNQQQQQQFPQQMYRFPGFGGQYHPIYTPPQSFNFGPVQPHHVNQHHHQHPTNWHATLNSVAAAQAQMNNRQ